MTARRCARLDAGLGGDCMAMHRDAPEGWCAECRRALSGVEPAEPCARCGHEDCGTMRSTDMGHAYVPCIVPGVYQMGRVVTPMDLTYADGYESGAADRSLGARSVYAETTDHTHYARGYRHGVLGLGREDA